MPAPVEFWFDFASTYSYVAAMRIDALAAARGLEVKWVPFLLGPIFAAQGMKDSPFNLNPTRGRYMWRDLERLCEKYGLAWKRPSVFPRNSVLAAKVACVGAGDAWGRPFMRAVFEANFGSDREISDRAVLAELLQANGAKAEEVFASLERPEHKMLLRQNTEAAQRRGFFGAPNVLVGDELFFGQDRLDDALAYAGR